MELYEVLDRKACLVDLKAKGKDEVLRALARAAKRSDATGSVSEDEIFERLKEREAQGTTGFGEEIAIPHARVEAMEKFLVFIAVAKRGVDFEAIDNKRVKLFFVILGPAKEVNEHLKFLASISRIMTSGSGVKTELLRSPTDLALYEAFMRRVGVHERRSDTARKMTLLVLVLYIDDFIYQILEYYLEAGIEGATILEGFGMGEYISNIPLFADFIGFMRENKNRSKTLLALVPEDRVEEIVAGIEAITGDMEKRQGAMVFTLDVGLIRGTMKML